MRVDKFLKVSRIIKRRSVANEACSGGRISINGKSAKPGDRVKVGDIIEIAFGDKTIKAKINDISDHVTKENADKMYTVL